MPKWEGRRRREGAALIAIPIFESFLPAQSGDGEGAYDVRCRRHELFWTFI
jgi:hypothetical protein